MGAPRTFFPRSLGSWKKIPVAQTNKQKKQSGSLVYVGCFFLTILTALTFPTIALLIIIIYMRELLDADWLRAVQFKCNTSAKRVTLVQITYRNSGL